MPFEGINRRPMFAPKAAVGKCGGCGNNATACRCVPVTAAPGACGPRGPGSYQTPQNGNGGTGVPLPVPIISPGHNGDVNGYHNEHCPEPYHDPWVDCFWMTTAVGEATSIAAGATVEVNIEPTQGWFDGYYVEIIAVDAANCQSRQRVLVGRFSVGDCPGDCRTIPVFDDVYRADTNGCCCGRPMRAKFGKTALGEQLHVPIENCNLTGAVHVQVIVRGYCMRGAMC